MDSGYYTRAEVVFLRSLTRDEAEQWEAASLDSRHVAHVLRPASRSAALFWNNTTDEGAGGLPIVGAGDPQPIPLLARWSDVQRAEAIVRRRRRDRAVAAQALALRGMGFTEREVADSFGVDRKVIRQQVRALADDILEELGGEEQAADRLDHGGANLCVICGLRPRVRLPSIVRKRRGRPPALIAERELGSCIECVREDLRTLLREPVADATHAGITGRGSVIHLGRFDHEPALVSTACCGRGGLRWYQLRDHRGIAWRLRLRWCSLCARRGNQRREEAIVAA